MPFLIFLEKVVLVRFTRLDQPPLLDHSVPFTNCKKWIILKQENFWQAFDLVDHRYVACKLHGLHAQWSEEKKQSYIRHALREYNIHKTLVHRHIVRLWDTFEIDLNTFCTVLEYCSGNIHIPSLPVCISYRICNFRSILDIFYPFGFIQVKTSMLFLRQTPCCLRRKLESLLFRYFKGLCT